MTKTTTKRFFSNSRFLPVALLSVAGAAFGTQIAAAITEVPVSPWVLGYGVVLLVAALIVDGRR